MSAADRICGDGGGLKVRFSQVVIFKLQQKNETCCRSGCVLRRLDDVKDETNQLKMRLAWI